MVESPKAITRERLTGWLAYSKDARLMIVEILHTIRVSILRHKLLAEPFLIVALIAGVRRILILTVEAARFLPDQPEQFHRVLLEMGLLTVFFIVIVGSIVLVRRLTPTAGAEAL